VEGLATGASGSIFSFTQNPGTHTIWFASADFGAGANMYLYEVPLAFNSAAVQKAAFPAPHGGGNGPIIFLDASTLLYGESPFGGDGYFHQVNTATGNIVIQDYLHFAGGLAGAVYGFDGKIYVTTGAGMAVYRISGQTKTQVASTTLDAQALAFDGERLYLSLQKPLENPPAPDDGEIHFGAITKKPDTGGGGGGGGGGCFIRAAAGEIPKARPLPVLLGLLGAMAVRRFVRGRPRPRVD
jgi:hypothetical protein